MKLTVDTIVEHAKEVESEDPIDFGMLAVDEDSMFKMIASSMLEHYESLDPENRDLMLLAVSTKLVVENFVLNLKLQQK
jgi:hypothetical protein